MCFQPLAQSAIGFWRGPALEEMELDEVGGGGRRLWGNIWGWAHLARLGISML